MTRFEMIGCNMQTESVSVEQANRRFSNSCDLCALRGLRIECDSCAIAEQHRIVVAAFRDMKDIEASHLAELRSLLGLSGHAGGSHEENDSGCGVGDRFDLFQREAVRRI